MPYTSVRVEAWVGGRTSISKFMCLRCGVELSNIRELFVREMKGYIAAEGSGALKSDVNGVDLLKAVLHGGCFNFKCTTSAGISIVERTKRKIISDHSL